MAGGLVWLIIIIMVVVIIWKTADPGIPSNIWNEGSTTKRVKISSSTEKTEEIGVFIFMDNMVEGED